jgi:hypothetical protein
MVDLNPWYIVGFIEGEGCFAITISKHKTKKLGLDARLVFEIELRGDDRPILEKIQKYFGLGNIYSLNYKRYGWFPHVKYSVHSLKALKKVIIPFFKKYKLKGKKAKDFKLFCQAVKIFDKKEHLTLKGIKKLKDLRKFMNKKRPLSQ